MSKRAKWDTAIEHLLIAERVLRKAGVDQASEAYIAIANAIHECEQELYHAAMEDKADMGA
jgi:hemoglobin-like flavoprotein